METLTSSSEAHVIFKVETHCLGVLKRSAEAMEGASRARARAVGMEVGNMSIE